MKNKLLKTFCFLFVSLLFVFSCKHDKGGGNDGKEKVLLLSSFKVGENAYNKGEKKILVTRSALKYQDIQEIVFTDESGNAVANVEWKMNPERVPLSSGEGKFTIEVSNPPQGYKPFKSDEITAVRELVSPKVTTLKVHGQTADISKQPFTVRVPHPTCKAPIYGPLDVFPGDIEIEFDKEVDKRTVMYIGLPQQALSPEAVAHATIKVPAKNGAWKEGEYKLDITFDTPPISVKELKVTDQDGDTDLSELKNGKIKLMLKNSKDSVTQADITVKFGGDYISDSELNAASATYEGLPLSGLEVSNPKTFTLKVAAKDKAYKAFEATVTVIRANKPLTLKRISVFTKPITTLDKLETTVDTMQTFIEGKDIKATFTTPTNEDKELPCTLIAGDKLSLKAGVENVIEFKVLATDAYAEYRNKIKITHLADWEKMIALPMPPEGAKWKSGNRDETDVSLNRKIEIAQFPVTFKLWKTVIDWMKGSEGQAKGYKNVEVIERHGQNGTIREPNAQYGGGHPYDENDKDHMMPVCAISYHAAIVWCNAYSEMKGHVPAYYKNEEGKIKTTWLPHLKGDGKDYHVYDISSQTVEVTATKEEIEKLVLRDALRAHAPGDYVGAAWENIKNNYLKVAILTAEQAKVDNGKNGFRLIDSVEWELASRLRLKGGKNTTSSTLQYNGTTWHFANKDCAAGSEGYGGEGGSEIEKVAWCSGNSQVDAKLQTHPIGQKWPTDLGFYDLAGNVGSWTNTWSKHNGSAGETQADYTNYAVGGGFCHPAGRCLVNTRTPSSNGRFDECGIRLARTLD